MIDPLSTWNSTFNALPKVSDPSWSLTLANWYADRITGIQPDQTQLNTGAGFTFVFDSALFAAGLAVLTPTLIQAAGIAGFASAWSAALATTIYPVTLLVAPGAFIPPTTPATLFSAVTAAIIDPTSIVAGVAKINELATVSPEATSVFAEKFRDATLLLSITVTGLNSITPTPTPLVAPLIPLT
jgi:hypothetical protein